MMTKIRMVLIFAFLVLMLPITAADFNPQIDAWYSVQPWELDFCSKFGGSTEAQSTGVGTESDIRKSAGIFQSTTTVTLQGEQAIERINNEQVHTYTIGWYIYSLDGGGGYTITLVNLPDPEIEEDEDAQEPMDFVTTGDIEKEKEGFSQLIYSGVAPPDQREIGYKVITLKDNYDIVQINLGSNTIEADII